MKISMEVLFGGAHSIFIRFLDVAKEVYEF